MQKQAIDRPEAQSCRGYALPKGMSPDCFEALVKLLSAFERDEAGLAEDVAIQVFETVERLRA